MQVLPIKVGSQGKHPASQKASQPTSQQPKPARFPHHLLSGIRDRTKTSINGQTNRQGSKNEKLLPKHFKHIETPTQQSPPNLRQQKIFLVIPSGRQYNLKILKCLHFNFNICANSELETNLQQKGNLALNVQTNLKVGSRYCPNLA